MHVRSGIGYGRQIDVSAQLKEAIEAFVNERSNSGVRVAQAVTSVTASGGVVTVTVDAEPVVLELTPFDNLATVFGTRAAFNNDEGVWLRRTLQRVDVVDAAGKSLGSMTAAELHKMGAGYSQLPADAAAQVLRYGRGRALAHRPLGVLVELEDTVSRHGRP